MATGNLSEYCDIICMYCYLLYTVQCRHICCYVYLYHALLCFRFKRWDFPNCLGSVDGKHITVQKPKHGGSVYFNYKSRESLVLMAVCDSSYKFTVVDIGQPGGASDGGVWEASQLGKSLINGKHSFRKM